MPENSQDEYTESGKGALPPMHKRWRHHEAEPRPKREPEMATVPGSCWAGGGSSAGKFSL